jgi:aminoglycoside 2''-phosphotransferase
MDKRHGYLRRIREVYPDLTAGTVRLNDEGQNSDILIVDDELVFRFPRYTDAARRLAVETALLHGIQGRVPLAVPNPIYMSPDSPLVGSAFVGYRMLPGQPLWRATLLAIDDEAVVERLARQLAGFLSALHRLPLAEAIVGRLPAPDGYAEWGERYARIRARLFPHMRAEARAWATDHFEAFLRDRQHFAFTPALIHGDFGTSNVLFDAARQTITGVIDFGGAGLGDPAYDVAGLLAGYGEPFARRVAAAYPAIASAWARVRFYAGTFALLEALFGAEHGDERAFAGGIAPYA